MTPEIHHPRNASPRFAWILICACLVIGSPVIAEELTDPEIETLETIEVPGSMVIQEDRQLPFPEPALHGLSPFLPDDVLRPIVDIPLKHHFAITSIAIDQTGKTRGIRSPVTTMKADHPPYPRFAREQGWEGTVVLRLVVGPEGKVASATTRKSSGYPVLDEHALQTVQQWIFHPAKDGEFSITTTVDVPIHFKLNQ